MECICSCWVESPAVHSAAIAAALTSWCEVEPWAGRHRIAVWTAHEGCCAGWRLVH